MDASLRAVVELIHASPARAVVAVSGGASQALGWLLSAPGASSTVLEATVPYSRRSMIDLLGRMPAQFVSRSAAEDIALAAYNKALRLSPPGIPVIGLGCTCALVSKAPKRGDHRCFIAARSQSSLREYALTLQKGTRDRLGEDEVTSRLLLQALADASGVAATVPMELGGAGEGVECVAAEISPQEQVQQLLSGRIPMITLPGEGGAAAAAAAMGDGRRVVLSGSFNPLHDGHLQLMSAACLEAPGSVPCFEIAAVNADKPPVPAEEVLSRAAQFRQRGLMLVVTDQPFFFEKARLLPDSTFVVGYDTAVRLINEKYYGGSRAAMVESLQGIAALGCDFLVAGRLVDGHYHTLDEVKLPPEVASAFRALPESKFRADVSSTELRRQLQSKQ